jgi:membrane protease YdiL (CAAX protease family)
MSATEDSTEQTPTEQTPAQQAPAEQTPAQQAPAEQTPAVLATYDHQLAAMPWRGIVAIFLLLVALVSLSFLFGALAFAFEIFTGGMSFDDPDSLAAITPAVLLSSNLALAALIPISMLLQRWLFRVPVRYLFSVTGAFRWRWLGRLALIIVPVWAVYIGVFFALEPAEEVRIDVGVIALLAVIVLTTPLQAAGEEFGFRGLVQRSVGSWFRNPTTAFIVSTLISGAAFAIAHFAADPWLIAYYFLFGVAASIAARFTGGLEAPVLIHVVNNVLIFVPAALFGQLDGGIDRSEGAGGPFVLLPIAMVLGAAALSVWWARRSGVIVRAPRPLARPVR